MQREARRIKKSITLISVVLTVLFCVLAAKNLQLKDKRKVYAESTVVLQDKIKAANKAKVELEKQELYMQTKEYIEEQARERFGMVYPDEKVFRAEEK